MRLSPQKLNRPSGLITANRFRIHMLAIPFIMFWLLPALVAFGQSGISKTKAEKTQRGYRQTQEIIDALNQHVDFNYESVTISEWLGDLEEFLGCHIKVHEIDPPPNFDDKMIVQCKYRNVQAASVLQLILDRQEATYLIDKGIIRIIDAEVAADILYCRRQIFDCRKLLEQIAINEVEFPNGLYISQFGGGGISSGGFGSGGVFRIPSGNSAAQDGKPQDEDDLEPSPEKDLARAKANAPILLIDSIKAAIAVEEWDDTNGDFSISTIGGLLVVMANEKCISEIEDFLAELERHFEVTDK